MDIEIIDESGVSELSKPKGLSWKLKLFIALWILISLSIFAFQMKANFPASNFGSEGLSRGGVIIQDIFQDLAGGAVLSLILSGGIIAVTNAFSFFFRRKGH